MVYLYIIGLIELKLRASENNVCVSGICSLGGYSVCGY